MDNWLLFALLAPAIYTINVFVDKLILEKYIKDYFAIPIFTAIIAVIFATGLWIFNPQILDFNSGLFAILSGAFLIFGTALYFKTLSKEESSLVIILMQMTPLFVLLISYIFLNEQITQKQLIGFIAILVASLGVSLKRQKGKTVISSELFFMLAADLLWSISYVLFDFISSDNSFTTLTVYENWGIGLGGLLLYLFVPVIRKALKKTLKKINKTGLGFVAGNESLFIIGRLCEYFAITLGPVALVIVVGSTQVFFGIIFGILITLLMPKVFKEDLSRGSLLKKGFFGALAFIGIILVS